MAFETKSDNKDSCESIIDGAECHLKVENIKDGCNSISDSVKLIPAAQSTLMFLDDVFKYGKYPLARNKLILPKSSKGLGMVVPYITVLYCK